MNVLLASTARKGQSSPRNFLARTGLSRTRQAWRQRRSALSAPLEGPLFFVGLVWSACCGDHFAVAVLVFDPFDSLHLVDSVFPTPPKKMCQNIPRLNHACPLQVLWERGPHRTRGAVWSRVLLRARSHFASPRERKRSVCRWLVRSRLCLHRGKKCRGSELECVAVKRIRTRPQSRSNPLGIKFPLTRHRRPHVQHLLSRGLALCLNTFSVAFPCLLWPRQGAESPQPVDGVTGYACPPGTYCPAGSSFPLGCPPGTYNPSEAMEECEECLPGFICPGNTTFPEECPVYHFCPPGSATGTTCPVGTYGARVSMRFRRNPKTYTPTLLYMERRIITLAC